MAGTLKLGATGGQILFSTSGTSGFSTPLTGYGSLYYGSDKQLRLKDDTGYVTVLSSGGVAGSNGTSGTSPAGGSSGTSGQNGTSGTSGTNGSQGPAGTSGTSGQAGTSGTSGNSGTSGSAGSSGESGTSGVGVKGATGNLAISYDDSALFSIDTSPGSTAINNIAIGTNSQYALVNGANNIGIGSNSLYNNDGDNNIGIGYGSFEYNDGNNNLGVGFNSGANINTGDANISLGLGTLGNRGTLGNANSVSNNIAIGRNALGDLWSQSSNNIAIGVTALLNLGDIGLGATGSTGNINNVAIGRQAGINITTGSNNTIIGYTGGTAGMTGTVVLSNGNNTTELVINSSVLQSGTYSANRRMPIKIGGTTYYLMLST